MSQLQEQEILQSGLEAAVVDTKNQNWLDTLQNEGHSWRAIFEGPSVFVVLLLATLLIGLAWQVPFRYTLDASNELRLDQPFLHNFNTVENTLPKGKGDWYRWSKGEGSIAFAGVGKRAYRVQLTVAGGINPKPNYVFYANAQKVAEGQLEAGPKSYTFEIPATAISGKNGDLRLALVVPEFVPKEIGLGGDVRELGFVFYSAKLEPIDNNLILPPATQLGWLLGVVLLVYVLLARAGFANPKAVGVALTFAAIVSYIIATPEVRVWLTIYSERVAFAFGWALLVSLFVAIPLRTVWQTTWERRWLLAIFGFGLALRLTGLLHPQTETNPTNIIDLGFHLNRYADFWDGGQWWVKIRSTEWGNRLTFYPVTTYTLMGLFQWLIPDRRLLNLVWMATLESSRALLLFYLVKRVTRDGRAALIAAFLMVALPMNTLSLAWGQTANLFGEWLILVAVCIVVVKWDSLRQPQYFAILTLTLLASFIVHPGEVLVSGIGFLGTGLLLFGLRKTRPQAKIFLAAYGLAIVLAFASYHWVTVQQMIPQAFESLDSRLKGGSVSTTIEQKGFRVGGQVRDARLGLTIDYVQTVPEMLVGGLRGFWREARVYYDILPLLLFPAGVFWLWKRRTDPPKGRLFWLSVAWLATFGLFAMTGLLLNLYVRYWLFLLPIVAAGVGIFLGMIWTHQARLGRGWMVALFTFALAAWLAISTLSLFLDRIIYYARGA